MITDDTAYEAHMKKVDIVLLGIVGLTHMDGEDTATRARFDAGMTAPAHAQMILDDWGFFDE